MKALLLMLSWSAGAAILLVGAANEPSMAMRFVVTLVAVLWIVLAAGEARRIPGAQ